MRSRVFNKRTVCGFLFFFLCAGVYSDHAKNSDYKIFTADLNFYPRVSGVFKSGSRICYYFLGNRYLAILNDQFKIAQNIILPVNTTSIDIGDINGDGYDDLIEVQRNRVLVQYQSLNGFSGPQVLINGYFLSPPNVQNIEQIHFLEDVDKDRFSDLIIPSDTSYVYYKNYRGTFKREKTINCPYESQFSDRYWKNSDLRANHLLLKTYVPTVYFLDINHDGTSDLYCRYKTLVYYYLSAKNKNGQMEPFSERIIRTYALNLENEYGSDFKLEDMNLDGHFDAVFSVVSGLGTHIKTDVKIFWSNGAIPEPSENFSMEENGGFFTALTMDNQKDRQHDKILLLPSLNIGLPFFLSYLLEKKLLVTGNVYRVKGRKLEKISEHSLSFLANDNLFPGFTTGDFNGDGYGDVVMAKDFGKISIYYGDSQMKGKKSLSISVPGYGIISSIKNPFSKSDKEELIIYLPQAIPGYNSLRVYRIIFY